MPLKIKFIIFAIFISTVFGSSFYMHGQLERTVSENLNKVQADYYPALEIAITNNNLLLQFDQHIQTAVMLAEEEYIESAIDIINHIDRNLKQLAQISKLHKSEAKQLNDALLELGENSTNTALLFIDGETDVAELSKLAQANTASFNTLVSNSKDIKSKLEAEFEQIIANTLEEARIAKQDFLVFNIVSLIILMFAGLYAWRSSSKMSRNLNRVSSSLQRFAEGDGDLSVRIDYHGKDELAELVTWFNLFVERLQGSMQDTAKNIDKLAKITEQLHANSQRNLTCSQKQSQDVTDTSSTIGEMLIAISSITDNAISASQTTVEANQNALEGNTIIATTIESITNLASDVENSADVVSQLLTFTAKVSGAINIISEIADQTNLLALNAAIEAARAGEQGRGFAVVADEVRNLASRTQTSTADIKNILDDLNKISNTASTAMNRGVEQANKSVTESYNAVEALANITAKVSIINELNEHIAAAAEQQRSASNVIEVSIGSIADNASDVKDNADELDQISTQIQQLSQQFQHLTQQFRL